MGSTISVPYREVLSTCVGGKERIQKWSLSIGVITGTFSIQAAHSAKDDTAYSWISSRSLTHLPLTSLFYPILSIPTTVHRLFTPTLNLLGRYRDSFSDGSQSRALAQFREEVERGGAEGVLGKVRDHWGRQLKNQRESIEKQREMEKSQIAQARSEPKNNQPASSGLRQAYLAKERHRKEQQRQVEREGVKKVGKEVEGKGE